MEITIKFEIDPNDLEVMPTLLDAPSRGPIADFVDLIQWAVYDNREGPQLEGNFKVIPNYKEKSDD